MANNPDRWDYIQNIVGADGNVPHITGGCIRDFLWGVQPKDIDVFVRADNDIGVAQIDENCLNQGWTRLPQIANQYNTEDGAIRAIRDYQIGDDHVQIIFLNVFTHIYINRFDFEISKGFYLGSKLHIPKETLRDVMNRTWTYCGPMDDATSVERSTTRAASYALRHPNLQFTVQGLPT
jgi:hypothetical protein